MDAPSPSGPSVSLPDLDRLRSEALSDDPETRARVADRLRALMEERFEEVFDATQEWALDPDERLREVVCRSLRHRSELSEEVRVRRLVSRAELFLGDRSPRVSKVATLDVLPYLLGFQPAVAAGWIKTWTGAPEEPVRADLATVLGAIAERYPTEAVEGLSELAVDPRPKVRSAVEHALDDLARRHPKMRPYLESRFPDFFGSD